MAYRGFPPVAELLPDEKEHRRKLAQTLNGVLRGKINAFLDVTLTASSLTTTITDSRISPFSALLFEPTTANAAAALAGLYTSGKTNGSAVLNHASNAQTDRHFRVVILG